MAWGVSLAWLGSLSIAK
uniref:Uncharacterized protein n=1 Tax=Anguilla anguilla TaxID=7936 RepID=A0A0E9UX18_ANGAN